MRFLDDFSWLYHFETERGATRSDPADLLAVAPAAVVRAGRQRAGQEHAVQVTRVVLDATCIFKGNSRILHT